MRFFVKLLLQCMLGLQQCGMDAHPGPEQIHTDRFVYVIHGTEFQSPDFLFRFTVSRKYDNAQFAEPSFPLQCLEHLETVHVRHFDVEYHQADVPVLRKKAQRFCAAVGSQYAIHVQRFAD